MQQFYIKISLKSFESSTLQTTKDKIKQFCYVFPVLFKEQAVSLVATKIKEEKCTIIEGHNNLVQMDQGIRSHSPCSLKRTGDNLCVVNTTCKGSFSYQPVPSHTEKFTLLRSPHIDKKSREQFERHTYKGQIQVLLRSRRLLLLLLFLLKNSEFPGIELTITIVYPTSLYC